MAVPFPEAQIEALIYMVLGSLLTIVTVLIIYIRRLHRRMEENSEKQENNGKELKIDNIGLSKKSEDILDRLLEDPELQSNLPQELKVSKATVSNGISELKERGLIRRKKKANTYLIEPDMEKIEEEQR